MDFFLKKNQIEKWANICSYSFLVVEIELIWQVYPINGAADIIWAYQLADGVWNFPSANKRERD